MDRLLDERDRAERDPRREPDPAPAAAPPSRTLATTLGNHAVARLARRGVARQPVEEEEELEAGTASAAPPAGEVAAPEDVAPDEAQALSQLDELSEDEPLE